MKRAELIGKVFGMLTVLSFDSINKNGHCIWLCECNCENKTKVLIPTGELERGKRWNCGCQNRKFGWLNKKKNKYDLSGEYGIGYTYKNEVFYFDLEDYSIIENYSWHKTKYGHITAATRISEENKKEQIFMHRLILGLPNKKINGIEGEHDNGIPYDNRKSNLKIVIHLENMSNKILYKNNTSGHAGVDLDGNHGWRARLWKNNKCVLCESHLTYDEAVKLREAAEIKYFGKLRSRGRNTE